MTLLLSLDIPQYLQLNRAYPICSPCVAAQEVRMDCPRHRLVYETLEKSHGPIFAEEFIADYWNWQYCICSSQCKAMSKQEAQNLNPISIGCWAIVKVLAGDDGAM